MNYEVTDKDVVEYELDGNNVKVLVNYKASAGRHYALLTFANDITAEVMRDRLREVLQTTMTAIRQQAYNSGWEDRHKKRKKRDWFSNAARVKADVF